MGEALTHSSPEPSASRRWEGLLIPASLMRTLRHRMVELRLPVGGRESEPACQMPGGLLSVMKTL